MSDQVEIDVREAMSISNELVYYLRDELEVPASLGRIAMMFCICAMARDSGKPIQDFQKELGEIFKISLDLAIGHG